VQPTDQSLYNTRRRLIVQMQFLRQFFDKLRAGPASFAIDNEYPPEKRGQILIGLR
jgi:hypothetical protein